MLRGGVPASSKANVNYAVYFSTNSTINKLESDRLAGGRVGVFFPARESKLAHRSSNSCRKGVIGPPGSILRGSLSRRPSIFVPSLPGLGAREGLLD